MSLDYQGKDLYFEGDVKLSDIIKENEGHACYVYHLGNLKKRYQTLQDSLSGLSNLSIHYAMKANANPLVLKTLCGLGASVDIVSGGEMDIALKNGFKASDVIFSGVGKTKEEIIQAIRSGIKQINVESTQELIRIGELSKKENKKVSVAFRMNPEVNPDTHPYITTGMSENKFGMDRSFIPELIRILKQYEGLNLRGLTMHIGSQILELGVMEEAIEKLLSIYREFEVLGFKMESLDIGGGVGIHYNETSEDKDFEMMKAYGAKVSSLLKDFPGEIIIEPGRVIVARCGVLLCQVEYIKETPYKNFAIVNTGMHQILRPALYQANHQILPLKNKEDMSQKLYDVVGPICESSDFIGKKRTFPELEQGDFLAICDAGAYGFAMASQYNAHPMPKEFIVG